MASLELDRFLKGVVDDHSLATGIKPLSTHIEIVAYANSCNFLITLSEWGRYVAMDLIQLSDQQLEAVLLTDPNHWTWAFQQVGPWRAMLMESSLSEGKLPQVGSSIAPQDPSLTKINAPSPVEEDDAEKDMILDQFIIAVKSDKQLLEQIKLAKDEDEVRQIAESKGYLFDSMTMLRKWSKHSDFSQATWFGWFND